jgi:NAD(P)-dependent dehydrogenase (short-subunit alcohol dehydrogenase family)
MNDNPFSLKDKNIIVVGASSGIGRQCAISLSQLDANLILIARREEKLKETLSLLKNNNHLYYSADITDHNLLEPIISDSVDRLGKISGFVFSAGKEIIMPINIINQEAYNDLFSVNVFSAFELVKIISKKKFINPEASIVLIASITSVIGDAGLSLYAATKGALVSGVKSMAIELAGKKIRINCISPGLIKTDMFDVMADKISQEQIQNTVALHPLGLGTVEDVANACIYLLSNASKWVTGTNLIVDGGFTAR